MLVLGAGSASHRHQCIAAALRSVPNHGGRRVATSSLIPCRAISARQASPYPAVHVTLSSGASAARRVTSSPSMSRTGVERLSRLVALATATQSMDDEALVNTVCRERQLLSQLAPAELLRLVKVVAPFDGLPSPNMPRLSSLYAAIDASVSHADWARADNVAALHNLIAWLAEDRAPDRKRRVLDILSGPAVAGALMQLLEPGGNSDACVLTSAEVAKVAWAYGHCLVSPHVPVWPAVVRHAMSHMHRMTLGDIARVLWAVGEGHFVDAVARGRRDPTPRAVAEPVATSRKPTVTTAGPVDGEDGGGGEHDLLPSTEAALSDRAAALETVQTADSNIGEQCSTASGGSPPSSSHPRPSPAASLSMRDALFSVAAAHVAPQVEAGCCGAIDCATLVASFALAGLQAPRELVSAVAGRATGLMLHHVPLSAAFRRKVGGHSAVLSPLASDVVANEDHGAELSSGVMHSGADALTLNMSRPPPWASTATSSTAWWMNDRIDLSESKRRRAVAAAANRTSSLSYESRSSDGDRVAKSAESRATVAASGDDSGREPVFGADAAPYHVRRSASALTETPGVVDESSLAHGVGGDGSTGSADTQSHATNITSNDAEIAARIAFVQAAAAARRRGTADTDLLRATFRMANAAARATVPRDPVRMATELPADGNVRTAAAVSESVLDLRRGGLGDTASDSGRKLMVSAAAANQSPRDSTAAAPTPVPTRVPRVSAAGASVARVSTADARAFVMLAWALVQQRAWDGPFFAIFKRLYGRMVSQAASAPRDVGRLVVINAALERLSPFPHLALGGFVLDAPSPPAPLRRLGIPAAQIQSLVDTAVSSSLDGDGHGDETLAAQRWEELEAAAALYDPGESGCVSEVPSIDRTKDALRRSGGGEGASTYPRLVPVCQAPLLASASNASHGSDDVDQTLSRSSRSEPPTESREGSPCVGFAIVHEPPAVAALAVSNEGRTAMAMSTGATSPGAPALLVVREHPTERTPRRTVPICIPLVDPLGNALRMEVHARSGAAVLLHEGLRRVLPIMARQAAAAARDATLPRPMPPPRIFGSFATSEGLLFDVAIPSLRAAALVVTPKFMTPARDALSAPFLTYRELAVAAGWSVHLVPAFDVPRSRDPVAVDAVARRLVVQMLDSAAVARGGAPSWAAADAAAEAGAAAAAAALRAERHQLKRRRQQARRQMQPDKQQQQEDGQMMTSSAL